MTVFYKNKLWAIFEFSTKFHFGIRTYRNNLSQLLAELEHDQLGAQEISNLGKNTFKMVASANGDTASPYFLCDICMTTLHSGRRTNRARDLGWWAMSTAPGSTTYNNTYFSGEKKMFFFF